MKFKDIKIGDYLYIKFKTTKSEEYFQYLIIKKLYFNISNVESEETKKSNEKRRKVYWNKIKEGK